VHLKEISLFAAMPLELNTTMKLLPTLKILLLAAILADFGLSSAIAQDQPASSAATTSARATKSTHSLRNHKRDHRRTARKSRVQHRTQRQVRHQQRHHKSSVSQIKSTSQAESPTQAQ
jgi:hypothetical protein